MYVVFQINLSALKAGFAVQIECTFLGQCLSNVEHFVLRLSSREALWVSSDRLLQLSPHWLLNSSDLIKLTYQVVWVQCR